MKMMTVALAMLLAIVSVSQTRADLVVEIDRVTVFAGQTAVVGIYVSSQSMLTITGFNLPLDINNDGRQALPNGFSLANPVLTNARYANTRFDTPPSIEPANVDAIPTGTGSDVVLSSRTRLFDLNITVASDVPVGTILPLQILVPAAPL